MSVSFPYHPYHGQVFTVNETGGAYVYDETRSSWIFNVNSSISTANVAKVFVSDNPPRVNAADAGILWVDSNGYYTYVWDGDMWIGLTNSTGAVAQAYVSPNPPTNLESGTLWYDSNSSDLRVRYIDNDSSQWVSLSSNNAIDVASKVFNIEASLSSINTRLASVEAAVDPTVLVETE